MNSNYYFQEGVWEAKPEWKDLVSGLTKVGYDFVCPFTSGETYRSKCGNQICYMKYYNKNYKMKTVFAKCLARIKKLIWETSWNKYGGVMMKASPTIQEAGARGRLMRLIKIKMEAGHFTRFNWEQFKTYYNYDELSKHFLRRTKYVIPVAEMNLYDGIGIMYEAQLERDKIGTVSLNDDVMSVVRGFLIK